MSAPARPADSSRSRATPLVAGLVLAAVAVAAVLILGSSAGGHTLRAAFQSAVQVVPGQDVRLAGRKVGTVDSVSLEGGEAVLKLTIDDDAAWPLRRGTTARLNFGLPASYASRFVELTPGAADQPELPDGGILTTADTIAPVEFDQMYRIFGPRTRKNFQGLLDNASATLAGHGGDIARGLRQGAPGIQAVADVYGDLGADRGALRTLVAAAARTAGALRRHEPALRGFIDNTAGTFDALAVHARAVQSTLDRLPDALHSGRRTLGRLDGSLVGLQGLVDDVRPGAAGLRRIAPTARHAISTLSDVAPLAASTLRTGERSLPAINRLLSTATPFMPRLASVLDRFAPMAACLRPYGPEIAGFASTWLSFTSNFDLEGHYGRASHRTSLIPVGTPLNTAQTIATHPKGGLTYAMPRPPGLNAGKPWFIPECGITPDALDPSKDPEARR